MTSDNGATARSPTRSGPGIDLSWDDLERSRDPSPPVDWTKRVLLIGLGALSWVATYVGMLELVEANMGELPLVHKVIIGCSVVMLMVMIVWLLDQMFRPIGWTQRLLFVAGYLFLTIISVGFGFGFYWKVLESRSVATTSAAGAVGQVQTSLFAAQTRLEQLQGTLEQLVSVSRQKAELERASGTSCIASKPGDGPRRRLRDDDAQRFGFAADLLKSRVGSVKGELGALEGDFVKIAANDPSTVDARTGTRNEFMKGLSRKLDMTVAGFNAFRSDPQIRQLRVDLAERADRTTFPDGRGGTFQCPDQQLQAALRGVIRAIDELPTLERPRIATVEGSEAVVEAFRRLTTTVYGALSFKLPPSAEEVRELQRKAIEAAQASGQRGRTPQAPSLDAAGLSKRDYIPLAIAVFVDLCLLLVSIGRPENRLGGLLPRMREAERGPVIQILSRFNQIHRDEEIRENFELFRHVVFDFNGDYYVAVPLDAPPRMNPEQREELRLEAALLANLFASFEQERLFSRVLMPLLPMASIRKKLRRQGSKFAEAEAFRVYKFRAGAWSEIILGAVMGAARRVEAEQRRRRVEDDVFRPSETPTLTAERSGSRSARRQPRHESREDDLPAALGASVALDRDLERDGTGRSRRDTATTVIARTGRMSGEGPGETPSHPTVVGSAQSGPVSRTRSFRRTRPEPVPPAEASIIPRSRRTGRGGESGAAEDVPASAAHTAGATDETGRKPVPAPPTPAPPTPALVEQFGRYARFMRETDLDGGATRPAPAPAAAAEDVVEHAMPDRARSSSARRPSTSRSRPDVPEAPAAANATPVGETSTREPRREGGSNVIVLPAPAQPASRTTADPAPESRVPVTVAATERTVTFTLPAEQLVAGGGALGAMARAALAAQNDERLADAEPAPLLASPALTMSSSDEAFEADAATEASQPQRRRPGPPPLPAVASASSKGDLGAHSASAEGADLSRAGTSVAAPAMMPVSTSSEAGRRAFTASVEGPEEDDPMTLAARRFAPRIPAE
jgi:hypothetical protein